MSDATDTLIGLPAVAANVERSVTHHSQHRGDDRGGGRGRGSVEVDTALLLLKLLLMLLLMLMLQLRTRYGQIGLVLGSPTQLVLLGEILVRLLTVETRETEEPRNRRVRNATDGRERKMPSACGQELETIRKAAREEK
jgi:hypothetical protein